MQDPALLLWMSASKNCARYGDTATPVNIIDAYPINGFVDNVIDECMCYSQFRCNNQLVPWIDKRYLIGPR